MLFNSPKHAIDFLKKRKAMIGTYKSGFGVYLVIAGELTDVHEIDALRYLRARDQEATIDKLRLYSP